MLPRDSCLTPLLPILESHEIFKVGVSIRDDVNELVAVQPFNAHGFIEITDVTKEQLGITEMGLRSLAGSLMVCASCV